MYLCDPLGPVLVRKYDCLAKVNKCLTPWLATRVCTLSAGLHHWPKFRQDFCRHRRLKDQVGYSRKIWYCLSCPTYNLDEILSLLSPSSVFRPVLKGRCEGPICVESEHTEIDRRRGKPAAAIHCLYLVGFTHVLFSSLFAVAPMRFLSLHPLLLTLCSDFNLRSRSLN